MFAPYVRTTETGRSAHRLPIARSTCSISVDRAIDRFAGGWGTPRHQPEPADFMITKEKHAHRVFFFRDHAERRS
jgi:hypothetical protein